MRDEYAAGRPHVVPVCFAVAGDTCWIAIDEKPKQAPARGLKRLRNIAANPHVALVADRWDEDWSRLGWVMLRGRALADLQQAGELVQGQMHRQGLNTAATADWLRNLRLQEERDVPDAHRCRSDAAESAIAVVTIHRSKGLEYPVVICPNLWSGERATRGGSASLGRRWRPPGSRGPRFDLPLNPHWGTGRGAAEQHAEAERQEAERKAYVACTRARQLLVLGWPGADEAKPGNPLSPWLVDQATADDLRELPLQHVDPTTHPPARERWRLK